jgi:hypothetical protein
MSSKYNVVADISCRSNSASPKMGNPRFLDTDHLCHCRILAYMSKQINSRPRQFVEGRRRVTAFDTGFDWPTVSSPRPTARPPETLHLRTVFSF